MTPATHTLRLILGDQLNPEHPWFDTHDVGVVYQQLNKMQPHQLDTLRLQAEQLRTQLDKL